MKRTLLILLTSCLFLFGFSQTVYEDFETGANLTWNASDGIFNGVMENPDKLGINASDSIGSYTKSNMHAYSLFLGNLTSAMDLSIDNQFTIQINAPVATQFIFKLEGPTGGTEFTKNIPLANVWLEYTFDFSSASGATDYDRIILFFDPGNGTSGDTYLFDNVAAGPAGPCAGTAPDLSILDDFECQRNATYGVGWDSLSVVANPDATGINTSASVGQYIDPQDEWSALVIDHHNPMDLSTDYLIKAKVYCPVAGQILFKLEGGASPPAEIFVPVTAINTWVEYEANFSSEANSSHKKIAIFFNAGVLASPGDLYFIDDIQRLPGPTSIIFEDFEPTAKLFWGPLNNNTTVHGTFNGLVTNPDMTGDNTSANVGSYNKGTSAFSTLTATVSSVDFSIFPQFNLQVLPPSGAVEVTLQLSSPTQGVKEVVRPLAGTGGWESLSFDFSAHTSITDFDAVNIIFDPNVNNTSTFYFDNLAQGTSTVDPCEGVDPIDNIWDDFECQRNVPYGAGDDRLEVVDNPDVNLANPSAKVGEYKDVLDQWSALLFDYGQAIDLSINNQFQMKIQSSVAVPLKIKLEGGTSNPVEIDTMISILNSWESYIIDFSPYIGEDHQKVAIFFNAGMTPAQEDLYYIDDFKWARSSYAGCILDYETPGTSIDNFSYFANGHLEASGYQFQTVTNPDQSGINTSATAGEFIKASNALPFAGMFADLDAPIDFGSNLTARVKVYMDHIGNFAIKLEGSRTGAAPIEISVDNTKTNEWEELTFDFSSVTATDEFTRLTVFFDLAIDSTGVDVTSLFDELVIGTGTCFTSGIRDFPVRQLDVYPNPVSDLLYIDNAEELEKIELYNTVGQLIYTHTFQHQSTISIDMTAYSNGIYILAGFNKNGLVANRKVIKR